jgi:cytochrome c oxidase subunit I+III
VFMAAFFLLLTIKLVEVAVVCGILAVGFVAAWLWQTDPGPNRGAAAIGAGIKLPVYVTGPISHSWWAMVVLLLVAASLFIALLFSYLYLWTVSPEVWPAATGLSMPRLDWAAAGASALVVSSAALVVAGRALSRSSPGARWLMRIALAVAIAALAASSAIDFHGHWRSGLRPSASSYAALVYAVIAVQGQIVVAVLIMGIYSLARSAAGKLTSVRRATFDNTMLLWHYAVAQGLVGLLLVHGFPRIAA